MTYLGESFVLERRTTTVLEAYIDLFLAIRKRAILDYQLDDWEDAWLYSKDMQHIWNLLLRTQKIG